MAPNMIRSAESMADFDAARALCWQYRTHLLSHEGTQPELVELVYPEPVYADLLDRFETMHAAPDGALFVAQIDGQILACGMYHRFDKTACEIKRVYVSEAARGLGLGRSITQALLNHAKIAGYKTVLLDTMKTLTNALSLYEAIGFTERGPYAPMPDIVQTHLRFFEYNLTTG